MEEQLTHLVVNWIDVDNKIILVGATDNENWKWETDLGYSGVDAKSIVWVTLTDNDKGYVVSEEAHFFCFPGGPTRSLAMSNIIGLFEIAWVIKNENMERDNAREKFFGKIIGRTV
ncbi:MULTISPECIES: hypothetical protein [Chryseobacterium]|uniref:hypothetical protein n=1 Tax=Chryseobacterium TaxID=59732 RepID=UPI000C9E7013|nr:MULTISPECIES: hypothetical protein [Chryseobacterium]VXC10524.1 conserved hypothetical protein [Chryseobacterium sp. 8AT]